MFKTLLALILFLPSISFAQTTFFHVDSNGNIDANRHMSLGSDDIPSADRTFLIGDVFTAAASSTPGFIDAYGTITEAGSGTHSLIFGQRITAPVIVGGGATVTNTATLYLDGPMTATVTGSNYVAWFDAGPFRNDGGMLCGASGICGFGGIGGTNNEGIMFDFETTANKVLVGTPTGVTSVDFGTIDIETDFLDLSDGNISNVGVLSVASIVADGTMVAYNDVGTLELNQADLIATCSVGNIAYDTGGVTDEICYCQATNTWMCATVTAGPLD